MMNKKIVLKPGTICIFDSTNVHKQDENGLIMVEILEELPRKGVFSPRMFKVKGTANDVNKLTDPIVVPDFLLNPAGVVVIRYPSDLPMINNVDIEALKTAIKKIESPSTTIYDLNMRNRLKALVEKLEFNMSLTEV